MVDPKLKKFRRAALVCMWVGIVLTFFDLKAMEWWVKSSAAHHYRPWIFRPPLPIALSIALSIVLSPLFVMWIVVNRLQRRILGPNFEKEKKEQKKLELEADRLSPGWDIPLAVDIADLPMVAVINAVFFVVILGIMLIAGFGEILIDHLRNPTSAKSAWEVTKMSVRAAAVCGGTLVFGTILLLFRKRPRIVFAAEGLVERGSGTRRVIPYDSILAVEIAPSRKVPALSCFVVQLKTDPQNFSAKQFTFGNDAPLLQLVNAFKSRGVSVVDMRVGGLKS